MFLTCLNKMLQVAPMYSWAYTGTYIFSHFNIVLVIINTCVSVMFLTCLALLSDMNPEAWCLYIGACVVICLTLVFSTLLYYGMKQKKPGFVFVYLLFGEVVGLSVVSLLIVFKNYNLTWRTVSCFLYIDRFDSVYNYIAGLCTVYAFILCMVYHTYFVMPNNPSYHQIAQNESCGDGKQSTPYYLTVPIPTRLSEDKVIRPIFTIQVS